METGNKFLVGLRDKNLVFLRPVPGEITQDDALLLAAYLVSMSIDRSEADFAEVLEAVRNT